MDDAEFARLYVDERKSYKEISAALGGAAKSTVYRRVNRLGLIRQKHHYQDLTGQRFGHYVVMSYVRSGRYEKGGTYDLWTCLCDCGTHVSVRSGNLKQGNCTRCKTCAGTHMSTITQKYVIDYNAWYRITYRCKNRGIELDVTPEYLKKVFDDQAGLCALSGVPIVFGKTRTSETTASPDRLDPTKGYIEGNVRWVHKYINSMRNNKTDLEFFDWCRLVVAYNNRFSVVS